LAPEFPELRRFLDFWATHIEGHLFSISVGRTELLTPPHHVHAAGMWLLH
jgi:uncharacterized protein Usg